MSEEKQATSSSNPPSETCVLEALKYQPDISTTATDTALINHFYVLKTALVYQTSQVADLTKAQAGQAVNDEDSSSDLDLPLDLESQDEKDLDRHQRIREEEHDLDAYQCDLPRKVIEPSTPRRFRPHQGPACPAGNVTVSRSVSIGSLVVAFFVGLLIGAASSTK